MEAKFHEQDEELTFRCYVTESLRMIPQNKCFTKSFIDFIDGAVPDDTRSGEEIVADIIAEGGLTLL